MPPSERLQRTPLHDVHLALGARMVPFAGFEMPVQYSGIVNEHRAVRTNAGLFDVSHMGEFFVRGEQAAEFVQRAVTNDVGQLYPGRAMYTVMCNTEGGTVDDLIVYKLGEEVFMLVVNAANVAGDYDHLRALQDAWRLDCSLEDRSEQIALIAIQGPRSIDIVKHVSDLPLDELKFYHFIRPDPGSFLNCDEALLSRTGYTGEIGLEIYCEPEKAEHVWQALVGAGVEHGLLPCGLGARDTLRLEAGYALYGSELSADTTPLEAGLGWVVKLDKGEFVGRDALRRQKEEGPLRRIVGFVLEERGVPRAGYPLTDGDGTTIGEVTSGSQSPMIERGIGLGFVPAEPRFTEPGAHLAVQIRAREIQARVAKPPFHKQ